MTPRFILPLLFATFTACANEPPHVRACNETESAFDAIDTEFFSGPLAAAACTPYVVPKASLYNVMYVRLTIGSQVLEHRPIDYVGARQLASGYWTVRIHALDLTAQTFYATPTEDQPPGD